MFKDILNKVVDGNNLDLKEVEKIFSAIMGGEATPSQIAAFITALRMKGETEEEITGAAKIMRQFATKIDIENPDITLDTCGTGGDLSHTFNISTATSIVVASCGVPVAKHGNRSVSSSCGSADVLLELGVNVDISPEKVSECINKINIGFLFAPKLHGAMKYAIGTRREIGIRTIFNILGPLTNPADAKRQLLGVFDKKWLGPLAATLKNLGSIHALIVHGSDGLDEITTTGKTYFAELKGGKITEGELDPADYGIKLSKLEDLKGSDAKGNADILKRVLSGEKGAKLDILLLNSGAALYVAGKVKGIKEGIDMALDAITSRRALNKLSELVTLSNS
jgi:anthranilate phosphoribosyltransferase